MFERRSLKLDLVAIGLLAVVVFLGLALLSYDPADRVGRLIWPLSAVYQPDHLVYPANAEIQNACGRWGALAADVLLSSLGIGAYYFVVSLAVLDIVLLRRQPVDTPILRLVGWLASLAGLTTICAMTVPGWSPGPVIGSGGYLGALGSGLLKLHFATVGGLILAASFIAGGLLLCTDYAVFQAARMIVRALVAAGSLMRRPRIPRRCRAADRSGNTTESLGGDVPIRIGGKRMDGVDPGDPAEAAVAGGAAQLDDAADQPPERMQEEPDQPVVVKKKTSRKRRRKGPHFRLGTRSQPTERELVLSQLDQADPDREGPGADYELPDLRLLLEGDEIAFDEQEKEVRYKAKVLERRFAEFGYQVKVVEIQTGPVIAQYEVQLEAGLRLSKIANLADDLAIALRVPSVRIVAPIPGKNTVGIEVPNETRQIVRLREVMEESDGKTRKMRIPLFLGKDVSGNSLVIDLSTLPHLLIAGRTGTGKSVCLNAIIASILMTRRPDEVRLLMIDPKLVELSGYGRLPHLMHPVVTDMRKAEAILAWAADKMEERYTLLARAGVRHISSYNQLGEEELLERLRPASEEERQQIPLHLPFIVILADEMADLMMTAGKEVEQHIIRLAQKSRAVGIHLILATQKPTVDVITGLIKSNLPARISFQMASRTDSRVVLDEMGAERLLGNGDMLFLWPGTSTLVRGQGTYLSDDEIQAVTDAASTGEQHFVRELVNLKVAEPGEEKVGPLKKRDELYESAVDIVVREGRGSVSLLQRSLGIGYGRAARLIDYMAEDGIVGPYAGSQAREVLITLADWDSMQESLSGEPARPQVAGHRRSNVILPEPEPEPELADLTETDDWQHEVDPLDAAFDPLDQDEACGDEFYDQYQPGALEAERAS